MRAVAADGGGADGHGHEIRAAIALQHLFAHALEFAVEGEREEGVVFGDVRRVRHAIDGAGAGIDEALHATGFGGFHHRFETIEIDGFGEFFVQFEAGVVRDAGQVQDGIHAPEGVGQALGIADIGFDDFKARMGGEVVAVEH